MPAIESILTGPQKTNLECARRKLGLRSRAAILCWLADNAVKIADAEIQKAGGRLAYLGLEEKSAST